jgi:hypothetical protein
LVQAASEKSIPQKFDLICHGTGKVSLRPYPPTRGKAMLPWQDDMQISVDASSRKYCQGSPGGTVHTCHYFSRLEVDRLYLTDKLGRHETVDLRTGEYVHQMEIDEGAIEVTRDKCRFAPFSGVR